MFSSQQTRQYAEQGYLVVKGLLDVATDIDPVKDAYIHYVDELTQIHLRDADPALLADYGARPFGERFAMLLGGSGGKILQHLDPTLSMFVPGYRWQADLPTAQRAEIFHLIRNKRVLDVMEALIGPEVSVSPVHHFNLKLTQKQIQLAVRTAAAAGRDAPGVNPHWKFHVGRAAAWHTDASYGFPNAYRSRIVNAWIPLTRATTENSCLLVLPGGHRADPEADITAMVASSKIVALPVSAGDVVILDNNLPHTALDNKTEDEIRWAFNFRYLPTGEPTGRPFLPSFVARSRSAPETELHDPELWSRMWRSALQYLSTREIPKNLGRGPGEADAITARWNAATRNYADWLKLPDTLFA